jgi:inosine-uridine nucleoside N-ribohydrolase
MITRNEKERDLAQKVILDVDTGFDDAVALLLAGHHPSLDLVAVTVTHGNAPLETTLENTLRLLDAGKLKDVPVYKGAASALVAEPLPTSPSQRTTLPLPETSKVQETQRAAEFLVEYYSGPHAAETIYAPVGPQTNLALALCLAPEIANRIPLIVTMGGAIFEGNTTPSAEFNILADPEAAYIVFKAGIPITMVGLEVTNQALVTIDDAARFETLETPWSKVAAKLIRSEVKLFMDAFGWKGGPIFDACAIAGIIEPDILKTEAMHVVIELNGAYTRGRTVADRSRRRNNDPNVDVGIGIDRERFLDVIFQSLK